jgi:hypothetical protein
MVQNTEDDFFTLFGIIVIAFALPSLWIARNIGADFMPALQAFAGTIGIVILVGFLKYLTGIRFAMWGVFGTLIFILIAWKDALYSSAFNYLNPNYDENDIFFQIGEKQIAWWGENWFFYGLEIILLGLAIFFWYRENRRPY